MFSIFVGIVSKHLLPTKYSLQDKVTQGNFYLHRINIYLMEVEQKDNSIVIPCPNPNCNEEYDVTVKGIDLTETLTENCDGCGNKVRVHDELTSLGAFNFHCIKEGGRYFTSKWEKKGQDKWEMVD